MSGLVFLALFLFQNGCANTPVASSAPLPIWPESTDEQHALMGQGTRAYLSSDHTEVILVLQARDRATTLKRFSLHNRIQAKVRAQISATPDGYRYDYTISNSVQSKDPIDVISMLMPNKSGVTRVTFRKVPGFPNWPGRAPLGPAFSTSQAELKEPFVGRWLSWVADGPYPVPDSGLNPGHSLAGFSISASLRPGFTTIYLLGQFPYIPDEDSDYPGIDLGFMGDRQWTDAHLVTIGPRFGGSVQFDEVSRNFNDGLERVMQCGRMNKYLRDLQRIVSKAGSFEELTHGLDQMPRPKEDSFEADVAAAIRLTAGHPDKKTNPGGIRK